MNRSSERVAGIVSITCLALTSAAADENGASAERGRQLYYDHACYGCHGYDGQTGARDLVGTESPLIADADAFIAFLRLRGDLMPVFPSTAMPSYPEAALSDAEARDIFAYIRTFELDAPEVDDVPALEAIIESASGRPER
jgi:cytochrome c